MKVFVISIFCTLMGYAAASSVGWPGAVALSAPIALSAPVLKTFLPGETKTTAYSTTQYINTIPASYSFGAHHQLPYQIAQVNNFAPLPTGYYSIGNPSYIPATNIYYNAQHSVIPTFGAFPALPSAPASPSAPIPSTPLQTPSADIGQTAGDADSAVIDSIDFPSQQQQGQLPQTTSDIQLGGSRFPPMNNLDQESGQTSSFPSNTQTPQNQMPPASSFPQSTQIPQVPQNPQFPQDEAPAFPSIPQIPQAPQVPQTPQIPQNPQEASLFPQLPQNPQNQVISEQAPQFPQQGQKPLFPPYPQFPSNIFAQGPLQSLPASFPAPANNESSFNDEDTIAVDSA